MSGIKVVCFGEVLWDVYPDSKKLGGAPFNVAAHLRQLGAKSTIISAIGKDALGREIIEAVEKQNISIEYIQRHAHLATGTVQVSLDEQGIPSYEILEPVAWDKILINEMNMQVVQKSDALVFGTLASRSEDNFKSLMSFTHNSNCNICDLNIRQKFYSKEKIEKLLQCCHILKINSEEKILLSEMFKLNRVNFYNELSELFQLEIIITTKGGEGAEAFSDGGISRAKAIPVQVLDTVGAGDAFVAGFISKYLDGKDLKTALQFGVELGGFVATQSGAIPSHSLM